MKTQRSAKPAPYVLTPRIVSTGTGEPLGPPPKWSLRLRVRLTRARLDRQIAAGERRSSPVLTLRVEQLTGTRMRQQLARRLLSVLRQAEERSSQPVISAVVVSPRAARAGRGAILELAERLEGHVPIDAAGVVLTRTLLTDGTSPLFNPHSEQTVTEGVHDVIRALDAAPLTSREVAPAATQGGPLAYGLSS